MDAKCVYHMLQQAFNHGIFNLVCQQSPARVYCSLNSSTSFELFHHDMNQAAFLALEPIGFKVRAMVHLGFFD